MTCTALLPQFSQGFILNLLHGFLCNALDFSVQVFYALWSIHCLFPRQKKKQNQKHRNIPQFPIWEKPIFLLFLLPPFTQNCYHPEALTGANHPSCALLLQWNWKVCFTIHLTSRCGEDEGKQDTTAACFLLTAFDLKPGKHSSPCTVVPQKLQCFSFTITHQYPKWRKELVKRWKQVQLYHDDLCSAAPCSRLWGYAINVFCN